MKIRQFIIGLSILALILSGCGQKKTEPAGQSFGSASQITVASVSPSNSPSPRKLRPSLNLLFWKHLKQ